MTTDILENIIHTFQFEELYDLFEYYKKGEYKFLQDHIEQNYSNLNIPKNKEFIFYYFCAKISEGLLDYSNTENLYNRCVDSFPKTGYDCFKDILNDKNNYKISILRKWIEQNGGTIQDIKIEYYDVDYRGMCTTTDIKKNKVMMKIPLKCIISTIEIKKTDWAKKLNRLSGNDLNPHIYLALELLHIKYSKNHFQKPIIECLPQYFNNVPINFSEEQKEELKGSYALVKIREKLESLEDNYNKVKGILNFSYTLEDYIWARTSIITRIYGVTRLSNEKDTVMVPFADMANHRIPANTKWFFDNDTECFTVRAEEYIQEGDNIYESYGVKSNYRYFVNYGFTIDNNPNEQVVIEFDDNSYHVGYELNAEFREMMTEIFKLFNDKLKAYNFFINYCIHRLNKFSTTVEEDIELLRNKSIDFNYKNCIIQRKGEKKLLVFYINMFSLINNLLETTKSNHSKIVKQIKKLCTNEKAFSFGEKFKTLL